MYICGRMWKGVEGCGTMWKDMEGCERVWKDVEDYGMWESDLESSKVVDMRTRP